MTRLRVSLTLSGVLVCAPSLTTAQSAQTVQSAQREPVAQLELTRAAEAMQCPDASTLRTAVARRLGRDPFSDTSPRRARLVFGLEGTSLSLTIELFASDGTALGRRSIRSRARDCNELAESAAVALVVAIDVLEASAERERAQRTTERVAEPAVAERTQVESTSSVSIVRPVVVMTPHGSSSPTPPSRSSDSLSGVLAFDAVGSLGDLPTVAVGAALRAGIRWRALGVFAEGRAMLPTWTEGPQASRIESSLYTGSALVCFHRGWFAACGVASVGALLARGSNVDRPREPTLPVIAAGGRAAGHWPVPGGFFVDASVELLGALLRPVLTINAERAWDAPPLHAGLRVGVGVELR